MRDVFYDPFCVRCPQVTSLLARLTNIMYSGSYPTLAAQFGLQNHIRSIGLGDFLESVGRLVEEEKEDNKMSDE